jgi:hypothetical protein
MVGRAGADDVVKRLAAGLETQPSRWSRLRTFSKTKLPNHTVRLRECRGEPLVDLAVAAIIQRGLAWMGRDRTRAV